MTTTVTRYGVTITSTKRDSVPPLHVTVQVGDETLIYDLSDSYGIGESYGVTGAITSLLSVLWSTSARYDGLRVRLREHLPALVRAERSIVGDSELSDQQVRNRVAAILSGAPTSAI